MDPSERLAKVSSLYGPGTVGGWLFTLLSVLVTWTANPRSRRKDTITNDLIATLTLPTISTIHLLQQIRTSSHSVRSILTAQDVASLQLAAAIEAPLNVCETFAAVALVLFGISVLSGHLIRGFCILIVGFVSFSTELVLLIGAFRADPSLVTFARPFLFNVEGAMVLTTTIAVILAIAYLATFFAQLSPTPNVSEQDERRFREHLGSRQSSELAVFFLGWLILFLCIPAGALSNGVGNGDLVATYGYIKPSSWAPRLLYFIPKTSCSLSDLDQAVALGAGFTTFAFSSYEALTIILAEERVKIAQMRRRFFRNVPGRNAARLSTAHGKWPSDAAQWLSERYLQSIEEIEARRVRDS